MDAVAQQQPATTMFQVHEVSFSHSLPVQTLFSTPFVRITEFPPNRRTANKRNEMERRKKEQQRLWRGLCRSDLAHRRRRRRCPVVFQYWLAHWSDIYAICALCRIYSSQCCDPQVNFQHGSIYIGKYSSLRRGHYPIGGDELHSPCWALRVW